MAEKGLVHAYMIRHDVFHGKKSEFLIEFENCLLAGAELKPKKPNEKASSLKNYSWLEKTIFCLF